MLKLAGSQVEHLANMIEECAGKYALFYKIDLFFFIFLYNKSRM